MWDHDDLWIAAGKDPMLAGSQKIWGSESNWGSIAQYARVQDHQCLPKPPHLTWERAAAYMLVAATAYRMGYGWPPNVLAARRAGAGVGRRWRPGLDGDPDRARGGGAAGRGGLRRHQERLLQEPR